MRRAPREQADADAGLGTGEGRVDRGELRQREEVPRSYCCGGCLLGRGGLGQRRQQEVASGSRPQQHWPPVAGQSRSSPLAPFSTNLEALVSAEARGSAGVIGAKSASAWQREVSRRINGSPSYRRARHGTRPGPYRHTIPQSQLSANANGIFTVQPYDSVGAIKRAGFTEAWCFPLLRTWCYLSISLSPAPSRRTAIKATRRPASRLARTPHG